MALLENDNRIFIAVDPGFDSIKVTVNGYYLKFPKEVADVTDLDESSYLGKKNKSYMKVHYIEGKEHLVGAYAATYLNENRSNVANGREESERLNDTFETFKTIDKQILIMSAIARGLIVYAQKAGNKFVRLDKNSDGTYDVNVNGSEIYVGVALPHDAVDSSWSYIENWLKEEHTFKLETADATYNLKLDTHRAIAGSQVIAALYGVMTDDDGKQLEDEDGILDSKRLPAIVIDGGYRTLGIAHFTSVQMVDSSDSNLTFAMWNIYENVAKRIREETGRENITSMYIKQAMRKEDQTVHYRDKNGKSMSLDAGEYVRKETRKVCEQMMQELRNKFDDLLEVKTIIVTGGTGMAYYEHIKECLLDSEWINVMLTDYEFQGENITPDYAIVIGMYKVLRHAVDRKTSKGKK